jgi:hypothetical protein
MKKPAAKIQQAFSEKLIATGIDRVCGTAGNINNYAAPGRLTF